MFITPMIAGGAMTSDLYNRPRRYSVNRPETRLSTVSSDASSLHRTSSTASNTSTSASSVSSNDTKRKPQHRRTISGTSFQLPRAFQPFHKKTQSQTYAQSHPQRPLPPPPPPPQQRPRQPPPRPRRPSQEALRQRELLAASQSATHSSPQAPSAKPPSPHAPSPQASSQRVLSHRISSQRPSSVQPSATQWQCSDLVVKCKGDVYHVDRTIMCYHSKWFARICAIMKTSTTSKSVLDLSADDSDAVAAMMQYCYQLDYTCKSAESNSNTDEIADLRPHVDVYMLAERYGISGLRQLALDKFENLATMVLVVNGNERLLLRAVRAIYEPSRKANADELRHAAITICANHVEQFISGNHTTMALVFESMDELPEFRTDLFEEMARRWK